MATEPLSLEFVLRDLHMAGVNCGVGTAPPAHIGAWILQGGERTVTEDFEISSTDGDTIARWLHDKARELYPELVGAPPL